jgi:hypothetical protein
LIGTVDTTGTLAHRLADFVAAAAGVGCADCKDEVRARPKRRRLAAGTIVMR